jgi:ankyrin repeat protein
MKHTLSTLTFLTLLCSYTSESNGMLRGGLQLARQAPRTAARIPAAKLSNPVLARTFGNQATQAKMHPWAKRLAIGGTIVGVGTIATHTAVNCEDEQEETPLIRAIKAKDKELVVRLLTAHGADINQQNNDGYTPLMKAIFLNQKEIAELLLDHGADINQQNKRGQTALIEAVLWGNKEIIELLLSRGADIDHTNKDGQTALIKAARWGNKEIIELLLSRGVGIDHTNKDGDTALIKAASTYWGNKRMIELLLGHGADINQANKDGKTALIGAVDHKSRQINNILRRFTRRSFFRCRSVTEGPDSITDASILEKVRRESEEIIKHLLDRGANIYHADKNGKTALDYACNGYIRQLLTNHKKEQPKADQ